MTVSPSTPPRRQTTAEDGSAPPLASGRPSNPSQARRRSSSVSAAISARMYAPIPPDGVCTLTNRAGSSPAGPNVWTTPCGTWIHVCGPATRVSPSSSSRMRAVEDEKAVGMAVVHVRRRRGRAGRQPGARRTEVVHVREERHLQPGPVGEELAVMNRRPHRPSLTAGLTASVPHRPWPEAGLAGREARRALCGEHP